MAIRIQSKNIFDISYNPIPENSVTQVKSNYKKYTYSSDEESLSPSISGSIDWNLSSDYTGRYFGFGTSTSNYKTATFSAIVSFTFRDTINVKRTDLNNKTYFSANLPLEFVSVSGRYKEGQATYEDVYIPATASAENIFDYIDPFGYKFGSYLRSDEEKTFTLEEITNKVTKYDPYSSFDFSKGNYWKHQYPIISNEYLDFENIVAEAGWINVDVSNDSYGSGQAPNGDYYTLTGAVEEFYPDSVNFSLNGYLFKYSISDQTITPVGTDTLKIYELPSSELSIEENTKNNASKVYNQYKNGKEIATILCSIDDYFDYNTNEMVITKNEYNLVGIPHNLTLDAEKNEYVYYYSGDRIERVEFLNNVIRFDTPRTIVARPYYIKLNPDNYSTDCRITYKSIVRGQEREISRSFSSAGGSQEATFINVVEISSFLCGTKDLNYSGEYFRGILSPQLYVKSSLGFQEEHKISLPMLFDMYDTVIPCKIGYNNLTQKWEDMPISTYLDGTPKEFLVVGVNLKLDGALFQELICQEVTKDENV